MVDAIGAVNSAMKAVIQLRKDQSIDWYKLTAREILEYADQGEDVPVEILRWAEDYNKLTNVPDDVSYESVNGSTDTDEINAKAAESEDSDDEDESKEVSLTAAQQERQDLADDGVSLYSQGKVFVERSNDAASSVGQMEDNVQSAADRGETVASKAADRADETVNSAQSIRAELDELVAKVQNDMANVSPGDLNKIQQLGQRLNVMGTRAQAELADYDIQLREIDEQFAQYENVPPVATDYGTETVDIGSELVTRNSEKQDAINSAAADNAGSGAAKAAVKKARIHHWRFMFYRNYRMGIKALTAGGNALDAGVNGQASLDDAKSRNKDSIAEVGDAKSKVQDATYVEAYDIQMRNDESENNNDANSSDTTKTQDSSQKTADSKTDENGVKDTAILTDPLEIQRRKEEQGLA